MFCRVQYLQLKACSAVLDESTPTNTVLANPAPGQPPSDAMITVHTAASVLLSVHNGISSHLSCTPCSTKHTHLILLIQLNTASVAE